MIKKRLVFTLLYSENSFFQSRNFNLQNVGDTNWLKKNYNFKNISYYVDELIILDVSRSKRNKKHFIEAVQEISKDCFIPITVGGGINNLSDARYFLTNGSDKILLNTSVLDNPNVIEDIASIYGEQSIIIGADLKKIDGNYYLFTNNGQKKQELDPSKYLESLSQKNFGELYLNSINRDGTGNGLDFEMLDLIPKNFNRSIILSGGTGNFMHIYEGLGKRKVDAISTANLLNFVGDGLIKTRLKLISKKIPFPDWDTNLIKQTENFFKQNK